ncbi:MAG: AAA family ATPase [Acidimicrobiales bacterium]|nr:AAA family ATPase [Acidimicrobiales bacterium]
MVDAGGDEPIDSSQETEWSAGFDFGHAPTDSLSAIAAFLGASSPDALAVVTEVLDDRTLFPTGAALAALVNQAQDAGARTNLAAHELSAASGSSASQVGSSSERGLSAVDDTARSPVVEGALEGFGPPRWFPLDPRRPATAVPLLGWFGFEAGFLAEVRIAVRIGLSPLGSTLDVFAPAGRRDVAGEVLADLGRRRREGNPFRGEVLRATGPSGNLTIRLLDHRPLDRDQIILPAGTWEALDRHVHRFLGVGSRFAALGYGAHTGVLITGPSGTGKTAVCRVLASEARGVATVVFCDPVTSRDALAELYAALHHLAPALVIIEHAEGAGPLRGSDAPTALAQFLTALDLAQDAPAPIVTLLTTSEPGALDPSARHSGRVHLTVTLTLPDLAMRRRILDALLAKVDHDVDTSAIARITDGASGADLHHLLRLAVAEAGEGPITTALLSELAAAKGWGGGDTGLYL